MFKIGVYIIKCRPFTFYRNDGCTYLGIYKNKVKKVCISSGGRSQSNYTTLFNLVLLVLFCIYLLDGSRSFRRVRKQ